MIEPSNLLTAKLNWNKIHFIGIGGIGMSGIAEILINYGYSVQGSDIADNYNITRLREKGINIAIGHKEENIKGVDLVVRSSAIKNDNPEIIQAKKNNIPILQRADMLAFVMKNKNNIAIAGSHGKTTTTSLAGLLLEKAGLDPTIINGGIINSYGTNAKIGKGSWLVAESDESDGSFIKLPRNIIVVTNIDKEHLDYYEDFNKLIDYFRIFISNITLPGFAVLGIDNDIVESLSKSIDNTTIITYGIDKKADFNAENIRYTKIGNTFDVVISDKKDGSKSKITNVTLPLYGKHNIQNALSVIAIAKTLGFESDFIRDVFKDFAGVKRRFSIVGKFNDAIIVDDYAHHPKEIEATIFSAKQIVQNKGRVIVVFQPHRFSRVSNLFNEFVDSLSNVDILFITDIYAASEQSIININKESIASAIKAKNPNNNVQLLQDLNNLAHTLKPLLQSEDIVLCLGAGDIYKYAGELESKLNNIT